MLKALYKRRKQRFSAIIENPWYTLLWLIAGEEGRCNKMGGGDGGQII